jgi:DNA-binding response OmpR family regulator
VRQPRAAVEKRALLQFIGNVSPPRPGQTSPTVLIVDDDEVVTQSFARMLQLEGYAVRTAVTTETGLAEARTARPDAIILDLRMPSPDGLAFLRRLRADEAPRRTPVAVVTGDYDLDDTVSSALLELGAKVTFKPLWLDDLVDLTRSLLGADR